jgi:hypothetical protein
MALAPLPPRPTLIELQEEELEEEQHFELLAALYVYRRRLDRRPRRFWVRPWIERRCFFGQYDTLMMELEREHHGDFLNYLRMEPAMFHELLEKLSPRISKEDTMCRQALQPGMKLAITLRYFATGNTFHSLSYDFRVPHNSISLFVKEVCEAIIEEYREEVMVTPRTPEAWLEVAYQFLHHWNFPHSVGALDGKHFAIKKPAKSGSLYHNYKGFFSIILLGLVDAEYRFLWVDVGTHGSTSDASIFNAGPLKEALESATLGLPDPDPLPGDDKPMPYFMVGDDAFALKTWMMKPHATRHLTKEQRIFNYRLSRARRIVENSFGILANRFQCLLGTMQLPPETATSVVMACVTLHNLMRMRYPGLQNQAMDVELEDHNIVPGAWRQDRVLPDVKQGHGPTNASNEAKNQRMYLTEYVNSDAGSVPWQDAMI